MQQHRYKYHFTLVELLVVIAILGGRYKGGDLSDLARLVALKARQSLLIGESAEQFEQGLLLFGRNSCRL